MASNFFEEDFGESNDIDDFFDENDDKKFGEIVESAKESLNFEVDDKLDDNDEEHNEHLIIKDKEEDKVENFLFEALPKNDNSVFNSKNETVEKKITNNENETDRKENKEKESGEGINIRELNISSNSEGEFSGLSDAVIESITYSQAHAAKSTPEKVIEALLELKLKDSTVILFLVALLVSFEVILGISGFILGHKLTFGFCVALFLPQAIWFALLFLQNRYQSKEKADYKRLIESFAFGFFLECIVFLIEWAFFYSIIFVLMKFSEYTDSLFAEYFLSFASIIFISFFIEALLEEGIKYIILLRNSKSIARQSRYSIIRHSITISLAISLFSSTIITVLIYWIFGLEYAIATLFLEAILSTTIQIITGIWIAFGFIKQYFRESHKANYPTYQVFILPVFIHGCYSCFISSIRVLYGVSSIHWKLYVAVIIASSLIILCALTFTLYKVQKVTKDVNLYAQVEFFPQATNTSLIIEDEPSANNVNV